MNISQRLRTCARHTGLDAVIELLQEAADEIDALQARTQVQGAPSWWMRETDEGAEWTDTAPLVLSGWTPLYTAPQPAQAAQAEVTDVVVGCLPTMNQDPYPALGDWWIQLWDGPSDAAMVIARVYGASPAEANEKAETIARAILALRPERVPMTDEQRQSAFLSAPTSRGGHRTAFMLGIQFAEAHHGITAQAKKEDE